MANGDNEFYYWFGHVGSDFHWAVLIWFRLKFFGNYYFCQTISYLQPGTCHKLQNTIKKVPGQPCKNEHTWTTTLNVFDIGLKAPWSWILMVLLSDLTITWFWAKIYLNPFTYLANKWSAGESWPLPKQGQVCHFHQKS